MLAPAPPPQALYMSGQTVKERLARYGLCPDCGNVKDAMGGEVFCRACVIRSLHPPHQSHCPDLSCPCLLPWGGEVHDRLCAWLRSRGGEPCDCQALQVPLSGQGVQENDRIRR